MFCFLKNILLDDGYYYCLEIVTQFEIAEYQSKFRGGSWFLDKKFREFGVSQWIK